MKQSDKFGFEDILVYFEKYKSVTYIKPEKAGADSTLMLKIKKEGRESKEKVKFFSQKISEQFHDLEFAQCSRWLRADGQAIKLDFWVQLKNPKWIDLVPSVSLSFGLDNCLDIRVDVEQDKLKNINEENPKLYHKILEQQFHLLDIPLKNNTEYRIREEDYQEYGNLDVGAIRSINTLKINP